ncbi:uncharacterized protein V6R79_014647 [Siganus canaliculatus]
MVKRCSWGKCKSDTRYPDRLKGGIRFIPFPKPKSNPEKCLLWIKLCGRPHTQLNPSKIDKNSFVCSKHFVNGTPSVEYPHPVPALPDGGEEVRCSPSIKREWGDLQGPSTDRVQNRTEPLVEDATTDQSITVIKMEYPGGEPQMTETLQELERLKTLLAEKEEENDLLREALRAHQASHSLTPEMINNSQVSDYFTYCTGFKYDEFNKLCTFFTIPVSQTAPQTHILLTHETANTQIQQLSLRQQFLLVLMKLRQNFDIKELAFKFQIDVQSVRTLFNSWIDFMYVRLSNVSFCDGFMVDQDGLGLELSIPPFATSNHPVPQEMTNKIAKHPLHAAVTKVKKFKILSGKIPKARLGTVNQIWHVACMLSNFQPHVMKAKTEGTHFDNEVQSDMWQ